ncbi:MAG: membrane protein insertase YidC, partial [Methylococcales bacterium]|nr:membrane protein insertase YidC [Methylococcales bacterium]
MDNIRFLLIVTFAMLVFMLQQAWEADYNPKPVIQAAVENVNARDDLPAGTTPAQTQAAVPAIAAASTAKVIKVTTDVLALEINTEGGTIQNLDLLAYPVEHENTAVNKLREMFGFAIPDINKYPVRIFNGEAAKLFVAQSGLITSTGSVEA